MATEPMALMLNLWTAILLGILYRSFLPPCLPRPQLTTHHRQADLLHPFTYLTSVNFNAFPFVFRKLHGFSLQQSGLSFLGIGIGMVAGVSSQPIWNRLYLKSKAAHGGVAPPEARLYSGMAGGILCPLGVFLFSATSMARIHWGVYPLSTSTPVRRSRPS
jgi:hypothetical protein